jgi:hypothetical protein
MFVSIKAVTANSLTRLAAVVVFVSLAGGCSNQQGIFANPDKSLQKSSTQFAADAAKRHYEADAPTVAQTSARAIINFQSKTIDLENLTAGDWSNVEVWLNKKFVLFIPIMEKQTAKPLYFDMFFDTDGNYFGEYGQTPLSPTIDIYRDGKMYTGVPFTLPDH